MESTPTENAVITRDQIRSGSTVVTASFSTEDGFQKSGLESKKSRSLREEDDFVINFKMAGYPNLKDNSK